MPSEKFAAIADIAALLGIPIAEAYRLSVAQNLERLFEQAGIVMATELPAELDPPPDFEP